MHNDDKEFYADYIECPATNMEKVYEFMLAMGQDIPDEPLEFIPLPLKNFRNTLIHEEVEELRNTEANDITNTARELADILYVVYGTALAYGIDLDAVFDLVHETNMLKSTGPVREDGKRMKPEGFRFPEERLKELVS